MTKTKLIDFDWDCYQSDGKAVFEGSDFEILNVDKFQYGNRALFNVSFMSNGSLVNVILSDLMNGWPGRLMLEINDEKKEMKTKLIPFNYEKYKSGAKAVFRKCDYKIIAIGKCNQQTDFPFMVIYEYDNEFINSDTITENGRWLSTVEESRFDIFLEVDIEEKTFWINVNPPNMACTLWETEKDADHYKSMHRIGKLKVTYTDEDLIK